MQSLRWNNEFCVSLGWSGMKNVFVTLHNTQEVTLSVRCMNPFKDNINPSKNTAIFYNRVLCISRIQINYNCYAASYWVEDLEVHLYIHGRVTAISKINLEAWIPFQSGLQWVLIMKQ